MSRVNAFLSRARMPAPVPATEEPERHPLPPENQLHAHHNLVMDRCKGRSVVKLTLNRGNKLVGKRVSIRVPTTDLDIAAMVRDALLDFCLAIGIQVNRRRVKRKADGERREP